MRIVISLILAEEVLVPCSKPPAGIRERKRTHDRLGAHARLVVAGGVYCAVCALASVGRRLPKTVSACAE